MPKLILFQGDSITDSRRIREEDRFTGSGYATIVSARLGLDFPGVYSFKNRGIGGNKISDLYARMGADILDLKPDYMSLIIGVNDLFRDYLSCGGQRSERFERDYTALVDAILCELPDLKIFLMSPFLIPCESFYRIHKESTDIDLDRLISDLPLYQKACENVAKRFSLPFAHLQPEIDKALKLAPAEYWTPDGIHPTQPAHEIIARKWLELFNKIR